MPLNQSMLESLLQSDWLVPDGGQFPQSPQESGQRFAQAVSSWFALAMAAGFPCATASARMSQLASQAALALQAGNPQAAGSQLGLAVGSYMAGQLFGTGVASMPVAVSAGGSMMGSAFADREATQQARAGQIAGACTTIALSTLVVFPMPPWSAPVS